ncbi:hypothetical protein EDD11_008798 [Mortierella claussenii]|nr:hypothetical protein EDD11_008798 [Mortierella claussenii]
MSDNKGHYSAVPSQDDDSHSHNHNQSTSLLTQGFQPPPYTPSTAHSSPVIEPHHAPSAPGPSSGLYPQIYNPPSTQQQPYQPTHQHPKFADTAKPPPMANSFLVQGPPGPQLLGAGAHNTASPLIMMKPPCSVENLKALPGIVVCQHCNYLVLTDTTPETGILGLLMAGITSCGCCLLPLCMTSTKDMMHSCPNCHEDIGLYSRLKERTFPVRKY